MGELITQETKTPHRLSIARMCRALGVSRAEYYRRRAVVDEPEADVELHDQIQRIALEMPAYGYRRMTHELRRRGIVANHKRVLHLMRQDNLLCLRRRGFVRTSDSSHDWGIYPNLLPALVVTGLSQLWLADITYVRVRQEFIYLAVLLDAFSRRCIGWALETELALAALRMALLTRRMQPGLVHHSDRGVQYACPAYTELLDTHEIQISMGRRGNPYDNAQAESFIKTLQYEEVYMMEYEDLAEAQARIGYFLAEVYNRKRLHSALGYVPPAEFEQLLVRPSCA